MSSAVRRCFGRSRHVCIFRRVDVCHVQVISLSAFDVAPAYGTFAPSVLKVTFSFLIVVWVA